MSSEVVIDCFPESLGRYRNQGWTIVAVDVIRATTTAVTAACAGFRCHPAISLEDAAELAAALPGALMVGELGGSRPYGYDQTNSPAVFAGAAGAGRAMVLLSTSGTQLLYPQPGVEGHYAACLRNLSGQVARLVERHPRVAIIGAGTRGEFREEDQYCCALLAGGLLEAGYRPRGRTEEVVARWHGLPVEAILDSKSVRYLQTTGQRADLSFVMTHIDDVAAVCQLSGRELVLEPVPAGQPAAFGVRQREATWLS